MADPRYDLDSPGNDELLEAEASGVDDEWDEDWDEDDEDDEDVLEAVGYGGGYYGQGLDQAPWAPLPTWIARAWQEENPDALMEVVFPTVYEEDRSTKLKDLATAEELNWISTQRAAEQAAKELGFEEYSFDDEQDTIKLERKAGIGPPALGGGDALSGLLKPAIPAIGQPGAGIASERGDDFDISRRRNDGGRPHRAEISGDFQHDFRRQQRQSEAREAKDRFGHGSDKRDAGDQSTAHKGYYIKHNQMRGEFYIQKDGQHISTHNSLDDAKQTIDRDLTSEAREALSPDQRVDQHEVLYMEDGGPKRCDRCIMWIRDANQCTIHAQDVNVAADMVCYLYVNGEPTSREDGAEAVGYVTPEVSGLGAGDTSCGNCQFGNGRPRCAHPAIKPFQIDNVGGCCNAWRRLDGRPRETVVPQRQPGVDPTVRRLVEGIAAGLSKRQRVIVKPNIHVAAPHIEVKPANVEVNVPPTNIEVKPANVEVKPANIEVKPANVEVKVEPAKPVINIEVQQPDPRPVRYERDPDTGAIIRAIPEEPSS